MPPPRGQQIPQAVLTDLSTLVAATLAQSPDFHRSLVRIAAEQTAIEVATRGGDGGGHDSEGSGDAQLADRSGAVADAGACVLRTCAILACRTAEEPISVSDAMAHQIALTEAYDRCVHRVGEAIARAERRRERKKARAAAAHAACESAELGQQQEGGGSCAGVAFGAASDAPSSLPATDDDVASLAGSPRRGRSPANPTTPRSGADASDPPLPHAAPQAVEGGGDGNGRPQGSGDPRVLLYRALTALIALRVDAVAREVVAPAFEAFSRGAEGESEARRAIAAEECDARASLRAAFHAANVATPSVITIMCPVPSPVPNPVPLDELPAAWREALLRAVARDAKKVRAVVAAELHEHLRAAADQPSQHVEEEQWRRSLLLLLTTISSGAGPLSSLTLGVAGSIADAPAAVAGSAGQHAAVLVADVRISSLVPRRVLDAFVATRLPGSRVEGCFAQSSALYCATEAEFALQRRSPRDRLGGECGTAATSPSPSPSPSPVRLASWSVSSCPSHMAW